MQKFTHQSSAHGKEMQDREYKREGECEWVKTKKETFIWKTGV